MKLYFLINNNGVVASYSKEPVVSNVLKSILLDITDDEYEQLTNNLSPIIENKKIKFLKNNNSVKKVESDNLRDELLTEVENLEIKSKTKLTDKDVINILKKVINLQEYIK